MTFEEIIEKINLQFGESFLEEIQSEIKQPCVVVQPQNLYGLCKFLQQTEGLYFDFLACVSGIDNGEKKGTMEVVYHLSSLPLEHTFVIRVVIARDFDNLQAIPSIASLWRTADWHEREAYDLFGIPFSDHPDLRRILLPNDWEGHPMRKDYKEQEYYHGITVKY